MDEKLNKLNDSSNDHLAKILWGYVTEQCKNTEVMIKVIESGKKSSELAKYITAYAKKKATGNMAAISSDEVFGQVNKFYGIEKLVKIDPEYAIKQEESVTKEAETVTETPKSVPKQSKTVIKAKKAVVPEGQFDLFSIGMGV